VGTPLASVPATQSLAVHPSGKFLYAVSTIGPEVDLYSIDATTGALTLVTPNVINIAGGYTSRLIFHPNGKFAYIATGAGMSISGFTADPTTGALTPFAAPQGTPNSVVPFAVDPAGRFLFAYGNYSGGSNGYVSYSIDPTTGYLTQAGTVADYAFPQQLACDPTGQFAFSVGAGATYIVAGKTPNSYAQGVVVEYVIDPVVGLKPNGTLNYSVDAGYQGRGIVMHPSGKYVYCVNNTSGDVYSYSMNTSTGLLTMIGSPLATQTGAVTPTPAAAPGGFSSQSGAYAITCDPSGKFIYVANWTINNIGIFSVNASTGLLTFVGTMPTSLFTSDVATAP
jgi:6-phosphogluconolactonase (cycloisomerase 2 family)